MASDDIFQDTDFFISLIEARPVLWDKGSPDYKDRVKTTNAWEEICKLLNADYESLEPKKQKEFCK